MNISETVALRVKMLGGKMDNPDALDYCVKKSLQEVADFCSVNELPKEAEIYLVDWATAEYLTVTDGYSKQWERLREDAEKGLIRFRRMRW